jgi:hypothetical protein
MSSEQQSQTTDRFARLKEQASRAIDSAQLPTIVREIASTSENVTKLPDSIATLRRRGYVFASYLEHKVDVLETRWREARQQAQAGVDTELERLRTEVREVEGLLNKGTMALQHPNVLDNIVPRLETEVSGLERAVSAADSRIRSHYDAVRRDVDQTLEQVQDITWVLDRAGEASFPFLAQEKLFLAAEAEWHSGKDDPDGLLYLTDQRLLFEQKEKTGKKLGLFGGKQTQELEWEIPLNQVEKVVAENKGLFGGKDLLHFTFGGGASLSQATVEVKGKAKCKFWAAQIERMIAGQTNDERAIAADSETLDTLASAPTACHVCGATLPRLVANQRQVECVYCGTVIRI